MAGSTTETLNQDVDKLSDRLGKVEVSLGKIETKIDILTGLMSGFIKLFTVFAVTSIAGAIWWSATMSNRGTNVERRLDRIEDRLDRLVIRFDEAFVWKTRPQP